MTAAFSRHYQEAERVPGQPIPIRPAVAAPGVYPTEALSPKLHGAALAIVDKVQIPAAIAANSVIAAAALAVQAYIDVELPTGEVIPTSLFMTTVAASGDRKSSADKLALRAVREREKEMREEHAREQTSFAADKAAYDATRKKAVSGNKQRSEIREAIEACGREPVAPPTPLLTTDEGTLQGLQKLFAEGMPSLGLFSDEGGQCLGGYAMSEENRGQTGAALSKLWDGAPIKRVRGTDQVTFLPGRRLSVHLMIQPRIAKRLFGDPDLKDQGLLSRILVCQPLSMKGTRAWRDPGANSRTALDIYDARIYKLLSEPMPMERETRELRPRAIPLSADARIMFISFHDAVELEMRPGGAFEDIAGFAGKLPEHAARLAAVMSFFEDRTTTEISPNALSAGIKVAKFHAEEALRVVGLGTADDDSDNAQTLITWIRKTGHRVVGKRWLGKNAFPRELRPAPVLSRAIGLLIEHGHLVSLKDGGEMTLHGKGEFYRDAYTVIADDDA